MTNEYKKLLGKTETRYVLEFATGGSSSAASVGSGSVVKALGGVHRRGDNLLAQEADKKPEPPKPRNFVAKNAKMGGAGKMTDKSKTIPRHEKHKKPAFEDIDSPEYNDEAGMSYGSLHTISRAANGLMDTIKEGDNLPEWCQEKISLAEDYLVTVWDYLQSEKEQGVAEGSENRSHFIRHNIWTAMDSDEEVLRHAVEGNPFYSAKKFMRNLDDQGYDFTHVISPDGKITYSPQHDPRHLKNFPDQGVAEGDSGAKYKVKSIGHDPKGDYYISPSTGKKVYKSGVNKGDHEVPASGEIKKKVGEGDAYMESLNAKLEEKFASQQQAKLMYAVAGDKSVAKKTGVDQGTAKEFIKKSHGQQVGNLPKKVPSKKK